MAKEPMTDDLRELHNKFITGNLLFFVIAIIAMLAQLLMPFLDMRIRITGNQLADLLDQAAQEQPADSATETEMTKTLTETLEGIDFVVPINVYPMEMLKASQGTEADVEAFFNTVVGKDGAAAFAKDMIDALAKPVLKASLHVTIDESLAEADLTEEEREQIELYKDDFDNVIDNLVGGSPEDVAQAKAQYVDTMKKVAEEQGKTELTAEDIAEIEKSFDELVEKGTLEDGSFGVIEMMKNVEKQESSEVNDAESSGAFAELIELLENPGKTIMQTLKEEGTDIKTLQTSLYAVFLVMAGIQAFFWGIFALSAAIHCFTPKKAIRTRYVRIFCVWCGLGVLLGNLSMSLIPKILAKVGGTAGAATIATAFGAFSVKFMGAGIVTGICWVAMVVVNLLLYRPVRKQLKR